MNLINALTDNRVDGPAGSDLQSESSKIKANKTNTNANQRKRLGIRLLTSSFFPLPYSLKKTP